MQILTWCSGFCSNLIFYRIGRLAWRFQLAAAFAPAIPILIFIWFCPGTFLDPISLWIIPNALLFQNRPVGSSRKDAFKNPSTLSAASATPKSKRLGICITHTVRSGKRRVRSEVLPSHDVLTKCSLCLDCGVPHSVVLS